MGLPFGLQVTFRVMVKWFASQKLSKVKVVHLQTFAYFHLLGGCDLRQSSGRIQMSILSRLI